MPIQSELEADISKKKRNNKKDLIKTAVSQIMLISPLIIEDFSKLKAENQALTDYFWGFA